MELPEFNIDVQLDTDHLYNQMKVRDQYGEFVPVPLTIWNREVEHRYSMMEHTGLHYSVFVFGFLKSYQHMYVCYN